MAIPKEGYLQAREQGRYGPIFPQDPGVLRLHDHREGQAGREEAIREYGKTIEEAIADLPDGLAVLKLHYLRWVLFDIGATPTSCTRASSTPTSTSTPRTPSRCSRKPGINTVFENLEGFPEDWKTNPPAFIKFVREHQCPSFLEYGEYPYVTADEIKKALRLKAAFSEMLDQMQ